MLVLSRKPGEKVVIGNGITLTVVEVEGNRVRLGRVRTPREKGRERPSPPAQEEGRTQGRRAILRTPGARGSAGPDALHEQQK